MQFLVVSEDLLQKIWGEPGYIINPILSADSRMFNLVSKLSDEYSSDICDLLNQIANQKISEVNCQGGYYVRLGNRIPLACMSTAEMIFLVSFAARTFGINIYLRYGMRQLTNSTLRVFFRYFKDCATLNILCEDGIDMELYMRCAEG